MAEPMDEETILDWVQFTSVPIKAVNVSSRRILSKYLNPLKSTMANYKTQDWQGFAECCGFDYLDIENFKEKENPTVAVLKEWTSKDDATVGKLKEILTELERWDILEDQTLAKHISMYFIIVIL